MPKPKRKSMTLDEAKTKIAQAYQVIGALAHYPEILSEAAQIEALDYFADVDWFDPDFLPWPKDQRRG